MDQKKVRRIKDSIAISKGYIQSHRILLQQRKIAFVLNLMKMAVSIGLLIFQISIYDGKDYDQVIIIVVSLLILCQLYEAAAVYTLQHQRMLATIYLNMCMYPIFMIISILQITTYSLNEEKSYKLVFSVSTGILSLFAIINFIIFKQSFLVEQLKNEQSHIKKG